MNEHDVVGHDEWIEARRALLTKEKEFTRRRDELSRQRRELPWERVEKEYVFEGPEGKQTLAELFDGRTQLVVYHFMFGPDDDLGCKATTSIWSRRAATRTIAASTGCAGTTSTAADPMRGRLRELAPPGDLLG